MNVMQELSQGEESKILGSTFCQRTELELFEYDVNVKIFRRSYVLLVLENFN